MSFGAQPLVVDLPFLGWLKTVTAARVFGKLEEPGLTVNGTISCTDDDGAAKVTSAVQQLSTLSAFVSYLPTLRNLDVEPVAHDVKLSFAVDDRQLRGLLAHAR